MIDERWMDICTTLAALYCRKAQEQRYLAGGISQDTSGNAIISILVESEGIECTSVTGMDDTLRDALMVEA